MNAPKIVARISDIRKETPVLIFRTSINMVFESVGTTAVFAAKAKNIQNIVLIGNLTTIPQAKKIFLNIEHMLGAHFIIPEYSQFGTVIGAALSEK